MHSHEKLNMFKPNIKMKILTWESHVQIQPRVSIGGTAVSVCIHANSTNTAKLHKYYLSCVNSG